MWIVDSPSPSPSAPPTPSSTHSSISHLSFSLPSQQPPLVSLSSNPSVNASPFPGSSLFGRLSGVVSLTDILNLYARASGLHPGDLEDMRRKRRGSSSSSVSVSGSWGGGGGREVRGSLDSARSSVVDVREKR